MFLSLNTYLGSRNGFQRFLGPHLFHGVVILLLILSHEHLQAAAGFLLLLVEVVDDNSDKQVKSKE